MRRGVEPRRITFAKRLKTNSNYLYACGLFRKAIYFIPLFVLPMYFGAMSTFVAEPISDFVAPVVSAFVYWRRIRYVVGLKPKKTQ
mgnify:CR=1 FL=1